MKAVWMPCPRCQGSGWVLEYTPHESTPERVGCTTCDRKHFANDLSCVAVFVPSNVQLPIYDSLGEETGK